MGRKVGLPFRRVAVFARSVGKGLFLHHAFDHAATLAFYFFLGTIPLLVLGGMLLGVLVKRDGIAALAARLAFLLPGITGGQMRKELRDLAFATHPSLAPLSALGFLWLTSNGFHNLMDVFELLLGAPRRSWWRQRLIALGWVAVSLLTAVVASWLLLKADGVVNLLVLAVLSTVALAGFYRFAVAHPPNVRRRIWPGTAVAMSLWVLVTWAFGAWVATLGHYTVYYGSLATVAVMLLWLYLTSLAFLVGAEVNAQLEGVRVLALPKL